MSWAQRLHRVFAIDVRTYPRCGEALRVLAIITDPRVIAAILTHLASASRGARRLTSRQAIAYLPVRIIV
jgi:hypothetical protein